MQIGRLELQRFRVRHHGTRALNDPFKPSPPHAEQRPVNAVK
jgi:hypothetical protein